MRLRDDPDAAQKWPNLDGSGFQYTSPDTIDYNCAAWALGINQGGYWWPFPDYKWPDGVPKDDSVDSIVAGYITFGFDTCDTPDLEQGYEKLAIFTNSAGQPKHIARQLDDGRWTSKMGDYEDIEHATLDAVSGPFYGSPTLFMRKQIA